MINYITAQGTQYFTITIPAGASSATTTINAVGSGAYIHVDGLNANSSSPSNPSNGFAYVQLTNSTTLTATRTGTSGIIVITGCIVDGDTTNLIKSVQFVTTTISSGSLIGLASISTVATQNTALHLTGWSTTNSSLSASSEYPAISLFSNTITASRAGGTSGTLVVGCEAIEYQSSCLFGQVQQISAISSANVASYTWPINTINPNNTITFYGGSNATNVAANPSLIKQYSILSATLLSVKVNAASNNTKTYNASVVPFVSGVFQSPVQRGTTTITATSLISSSLVGVTRNVSALSWLGNTTNVATAALPRTEALSQIVPSSIANIVQNPSVSGGVTTTAVISSTSTLAGTLLAIGITSTKTVTGITDNLSQTYIQAVGAQGSLSGGQGTDIWYLANNAGGVTSITVTFSSAASYTVDVYEVSGIVSSSPLDSANSSSNQSATTTPTTASVSTTKVGDFIMAVISPAKTSVASPFTLDANLFTGATYIPYTTVNNVSATFTGTSTTFASSIAAFKSTYAGGNNLIVEKQFQATGNITGSWEIAQFPAYVSQALWNAVASFSAVSNATAQSIATWNASSSFAASGASKTASGAAIATWSSLSTFLAMGKSVAISKATWVGSASLSIIGIEKIPSKLTINSSSSFLPKSSLLFKSKVTWNGSAVFLASGKSNARSNATWISSSSLLAIGKLVARSNATYSPHSTLSFNGIKRVYSLATFSPSSSFSPIMAAKIKSIASWVSSSSFNAVGIGKILRYAVASWSASTNLTASSMVSAQRSVNWSSGIVFASVGSSKIGNPNYPFPTQHLLGGAFPKRIRPLYQRIRLQ